MKRSGRRVAAPSLLTTTALLGFGCADPCVDDGFAQEDCPIVDTESAGGTASATEGEDADASASASASDSADGETGAASASASGSGADGSDSAASAGGTGGLCPILDVDLTPETPTVVLLVDQSGSMNEDLEPGLTRWDAVQNALVDPSQGVVSQFEDEIRFGMSLYTNVPADDMCPLLTGPGPALANYQPIADAFGANAPLEDTPTADALAAVHESLMAFDEPGPKIIVLATDGEPDTCAEPNPQNGQDEAIEAAENAFADGIETRIISVGSDISQEHLAAMANAGAGVQPGDPDATFFEAVDQAQLYEAFNDILYGTRSCVWTLEATVEMQTEDACVVNINDQSVPFDANDGWTFRSGTQIELVGSACDTIQEGDVSIDMTCGCETLED